MRPGELVAYLVGAIIWGVAFTFAGAFVFMMLVGVLHTWIRPVPTIGYWSAFWLVGCAYSLLTGSIRLAAVEVK